MNDDFLISLATLFLPALLVFVLSYAMATKILERRLTVAQSSLISAVAGVVAIALMAAYYLMKPALGAPPFIDTAAMIGTMCVVGTVVTRLARNYGIEKRGWFGLGARAGFWVFIFTWSVKSIWLALSKLFT